VGLVFEPEDPEALCSGLMRLAGERALYDELRANCLAAAKHYDRAARARAMLGLLEGIAAEGRMPETAGDHVEQKEQA
jgi:hypothetical protein